jgi:hypothetical protein
MRRSRALALRAFAALVLPLAAGCSSILGSSGWERVPGDIGNAIGSPLQAPAEARQGVPFEITVTTYGSGSCTRPDGAETSVTGLLATVRPFDLERRGPNVACTADLRAYPRPVTLRFDEPGQATIRVIGARGEQVEQQLTVRP